MFQNSVLDNGNSTFLGLRDVDEHLLFHVIFFPGCGDDDFYYVAVDAGDCREGVG